MLFLAVSVVLTALAAVVLGAVDIHPRKRFQPTGVWCSSDVARAAATAAGPSTDLTYRDARMTSTKSKGLSRYSGLRSCVL